MQSLQIPLGLAPAAFLKELSVMISSFSAARRLDTAEVFGDERLLSGRIRDGLRCAGYQVRFSVRPIYFLCLNTFFFVAVPFF